MLQAYDIPVEWLRLDKLDAGNNNLLKGSAGLLGAQNTVVLIYPDINKVLQSEWTEVVRGVGKQSCPIKTANGVTRFNLWYSPSMEWICDAE